MRDIRDHLAHPLTDEQQRETVLQAQRVAHALQLTYQGKVLDVILFGGYARGDAVDLSDVDLGIKWHKNTFDFDALSDQLDDTIKTITQGFGIPSTDFHATPIGPQWLEQPDKYKQTLKYEVLEAMRSEGKSLLH